MTIAIDEARGGAPARAPRSAAEAASPESRPESRDTTLSRMFALCSREQYREYLPEKRSLRIHGHSTTLRLERAFWTVLEEMALEEGVTPGALITRIYDHCLVTNEKNLASCLRVVCLKYINLGP